MTATGRETAPRDEVLVLIVDDFVDAREMMSDYLIHGGFAVVEAENGEDAIAKAIDRQPAVILMDLSMPVMDGWEAIRRLRGDPRTQGIPIIALTGYTRAGEQDSSRLARCDSFIARPCPPGTVIAEVWRILAAQKQQESR